MHRYASIKIESKWLINNRLFLFQQSLEAVLVLLMLPIILLSDLRSLLLRLLSLCSLLHVCIYHSAENGNTNTYTAPQITQITPQNASTVGGYQITISGSSFTGNTVQVLFGNVAQIVTLGSASSITDMRFSSGSSLFTIL